MKNVPDKYINIPDSNWKIRSGRADSEMSIFKPVKH